MSSPGREDLPGRGPPPSGLSERTMQREVCIRGRAIRLGQLLKLAGLIDSGAEAKVYLAGEPVFVNGQPEARRGRQLRAGDVVATGELELRLISDQPPARPPS